MSEIKKSLLRKIMLERQKNLSDLYIKTAGENIQTQIFSSSLYKKAKKIFIYVSTAKEPPTIEIIQRAWDEGKEIYVPKCVEKNMLAVKIYNFNDLIPGKFGILEPKNFSEFLAVDEFDLTIVPCLSASLEGKRLGHGGGYYDKFLAGSKNKNIICLCFHKMLNLEIPVSEHDFYMPKILTENIF